MRMDMKQRDKAIQRIKQHTPSFHINGLSRDDARRKIMQTYIQLRTELIAKIVGAKLAANYLGNEFGLTMSSAWLAEAPTILASARPYCSCRIHYRCLVS